MRPHAEGKHVTHVLVVPSFVIYMGNNYSIYALTWFQLLLLAANNCGK